jgi:Family of unknown function (DUF6159)
MEDTHQNQLTAYIEAQLQLGQTPDEVASQLRNAGWQEAHIQQGFTLVQATVLPSNLQPVPPTEVAIDPAQQLQAASTDQLVTQQPTTAQPITAGVSPAANGRRRGRIKTGWVLLKHCYKLLNDNRNLLRYFVMTWIVVIAINVVTCGIIFAVNTTLWDSEIVWYAYCFFAYLVIITSVNFYAAALSANVLDIYKGSQQPYKHYTRLAQSKFKPIFVYSLITAIIGTILQYIMDRLSFLGQIVVWFIGAAWSVGTMFVLPIIMDSEKGAPTAIKESVGMLKQTWGEGITSKVTVNAPLAILQYGVSAIFWPLLFFIIIAGYSWPFFILIFTIYGVISLSLGVLGSFANTTLNVALYYFAVHRQVPPNFDADMLNQILIKRKKSRFFGKDEAPHATV